MQCRFKLGHWTFSSFLVPLSFLLLPIEIRSRVSAFLATRLARKARFDIGQPDIIGPLVAADRDVMAALVVRAIDQETANARPAHFSKGDFLLS
jgi:hypothetical protein